MYIKGITTNVTILQKQKSGYFIELHSRCERTWNGCSVDAAFVKFLEDIVGLHNIEKLKEECMEDYIDLLREFQTKKRSIKTDKPGKVSMIIPVSLLDIVKKDMTKMGFPEALKQSRYSDTVNCSRQKLQIPNDIFRELFKPTIDGILLFIDAILADKRFNEIESIFAVGGFADCDLMQSALRFKYNGRKVFVSDEADLATLKGAVLLGHLSEKEVSYKNYQLNLRQRNVLLRRFQTVH